MAWEETTKLTAADGDDRDGFGAVLGLDGTTAVLGAPGDEDPNGYDAGSAYAFTRSNGRWSQEDKFAPAGGESDDSFGNAVAVDGDTALVGAPNVEDQYGNVSGAAYVFTRSNGIWAEQAKLTKSRGTEDARFGWRVALDGDTAVVTVDASAASYAGLAAVFTRSNGAWTEQTVLRPSDGDAGDGFGSAVAMDGDTVLVGASNDENPARPGAGSGYVFEQSNGAWTEQAKLTASDSAAHHSFGCSTGLSGETAVVGALSADNAAGAEAGAAYAFERSSGQWTERDKLTASDGDDRDLFGGSVDLDGKRILVGASGDEDPAGENSGSAYLFDESSGQWTEDAKLTASDGDKWDAFGGSVALDAGGSLRFDDMAMVGAGADEDPNGYRAGSAYVFDYTLQYQVVVIDWQEVEEYYPLALPTTEAFYPIEQADVESLRFVYPEILAEFESLGAFLETDEGARPADAAVEDVTEDGDDDLVVQFPVEETELTPKRVTDGVLVGRTVEGETMVGDAVTRAEWEESR